MAKRPQQKQLIKKTKTEYGGDLLKTREGRKHGRPLSTTSTMHIVLRSTQAKGSKSFYRYRKPITEILSKFADKYGIKIVTFANAGNHLHLQIKLSNRFAYFKFIRAVTAAIAMKVGGVNRWTKKLATYEVKQHEMAQQTSSSSDRLRNRFWDRRPFSRVVESFKAYLNLKDYIRINQLEGEGYCRKGARFEVGMENIRNLHWSG